MSNNVPNSDYIPVDKWQPHPDDAIINCKPGIFVAPIGSALNLDIDDKINYFVLSTKKCYNSIAMRQHLFQYLNYFEKYYDTEREYLSILFAIKIKMDRYNTDMYPVLSFFDDMEKYILHSNLSNKALMMVEDNYCQDLHYNNLKNPTLQYTNDHAKILHWMSILMDLCIPLLCNYAYMHKIDNIDSFLLSFYDRILYLRRDIDIFSKLYDTAFTNVVLNQKNNQAIWVKQDIRAIDTTTHSTDSVYNIILNIMPKYTFDKNIISFNYASIRRNTSYKITDISFEFQFVAISSSNRDQDSVSDFDKFESNMIRMSESLYLQNKINCQVCMKNIENTFGPFDQNEIEFYTNRLLMCPDGNFTINVFQKQLIFCLFYRWFKDTQSINSINREDYVKLVIAAKKMLLSKGMIIFPYIISGRIDKFVQRKSINKKEKSMAESSPSYPLIVNKYQNDNIINNILGMLATIISSDFSIVDPNPDIDGIRIDTTAIGEIIEEVETFILMC